MIGYRMAKLTLYPYTPGSYLSAATVEYNEDLGPAHSVIKSMTKVQLSVFTPSLENLFNTLPTSGPRTLLDPGPLIIKQIPYILTTGNK